MKDHYSTVSPAEQREGIGRVLRLVHSATSTSDAARGEPAAPQPATGTTRGGASPAAVGANAKEATG